MPDVSFLFREPSFSFLFFTGNVCDVVPKLLANCGYDVTVGHRRYESTFFEISDAIRRMEGPRNIAYKAVYQVPGGTVLLDPEMTVGSYKDEIIESCSEHGIEVFVAIWERFSQSILCAHLAPGGASVDVCVMEGVMQGDAVNPPPSFLKQTDPACLKMFLVAAGVPLDSIFGKVSARVYKLTVSSEQ